MFIFYDIEILPKEAIAVFKLGDDYKVIHNNINELKTFLNEHNKDILVGFNNYHYDDIVVAGAILGKNPYEISKSIIVDNVQPNYRLNVMSLDVMQELPLGVGLKSSEANLGMDIIETPIDFNLERQLTPEELELLIGYCKNDVASTEKLFNLRADYFSSKFEIVNEFELPIPDIKKTRAVLSSKVLKCTKVDLPKDRLLIDFNPKLDWSIIPKPVAEFFTQCVYDYRCGGDYKEIESRKLNYTIAGVPHVYAFGGIHGAIEKYNGSGYYLHIDVSSYYPSLIIGSGYMSRTTKEPELFTKLRQMRYELKAKKDPRQKVYKILINATFGAMKSEYNNLYDPKQANNICINGQLILTQLILEISPYCQLIQSNTDGIIVKYDPANYDKLVTMVTDFGNRFSLTFDIDKISKIAQRDVNNYAIEFEDGKVEAKGRFSKFEGGSYQQNTLTIIDKSLVNYYLKGIPVEKTVIDTYRAGDMLPFQIICKMGSTYDGMYYEYGAEGDTEYIETQKVNRVFATNDHKYWGIYKRKGDSYQRIANTSEHNYIHNGDISTFDKSKLDLNYYVELCRKNLY